MNLLNLSEFNISIMDEFENFKASSYSGGAYPVSQDHTAVHGIIVSQADNEGLDKEKEYCEVDITQSVELAERKFRRLELGRSISVDIPEAQDTSRLQVGQWGTQGHPVSATSPTRGKFLRANSVGTPSPLASPSVGYAGEQASPNSPGFRAKSVSPIPPQFFTNSPDNSPSHSPPHSQHAMRIKHRMGSLRAERMHKHGQATSPHPNLLHFGAIHQSIDLDQEQVYRARSFVTSSKGIINRGDSFRLRSASSNCSLTSIASSPGGYKRCLSLASQDTSSPNSSLDNEQDPPTYRILILGGAGVGKSTLISQFMTSEYLGNMDSSIGRSIIWW